MLLIGNLCESVHTAASNRQDFSNQLHKKELFVYSHTWKSGIQLTSGIARHKGLNDTSGFSFSVSHLYSYLC